MNTSGCMCTPWPTYGTQEGLSSKHTESFWVFLETCAGLAFDIVILENHPGLPKELVQLVLGKLYRIIRVVLGPEDRNAHIEGLAKSLWIIMTTITLLSLPPSRPPWPSQLPGAIAGTQAARQGPQWGPR